MRVNGTSRMDYTIRESKRAKRVILKVSDQHGLEVVIPHGSDPRRIPEILKAHATWIEKQLQRIKEAPVLTAPEHIDLKALDEHWQVCYGSSSDGRTLIRDADSAVLLIQGDVGDIQGIALVLNQWLHLRARAHLVPWLREVSREVGIPFKNVTVRGQATRWASCSRIGNISLNRSLLFLPSHLVRHVFLHELCHIRRLDHSPGFWQLLMDLEPDCKDLEAQTRNASSFVAPWARLR